MVIGKWTTSCKNTLQKSNVYLWLCSTKDFCIRRSLFFKTSGSTRLTSLSLAKFWIAVLSFNIFWPKSLNCIVFNVEIVKLGDASRLFQSRRDFSDKIRKQKLLDTSKIALMKRTWKNKWMKYLYFTTLNYMTKIYKFTAL